MSEEIREIKNKLTHNYLLEMNKKQIDKLERAKLVKDYIESKNISVRELARQLNMPHSTLNDWIMWNNIEKNDFDKMKNNGLNDRDVYRELRNNKSDKEKKFVETLKIDLELEKSISTLKKLARKNVLYSEKTEDAIIELQDILNKISMYIEKQR